VKAPLDLDKTTIGSKAGEANSQSILWLVAWGDSGLCNYDNTMCNGMQNKKLNKP
jgi:hypothetical protein